MDKLTFAKKIDSTLLRPTAAEAEIREICRLAREYKFATVALPSQFMELAIELLEGSGVGFDAAVGFPLGIQSTETKVHEAVEAVRKGATEVDMVIALGKFKSGLYKEVEEGDSKGCGSRSRDHDQGHHRDLLSHRRRKSASRRSSRPTPVPILSRRPPGLPQLAPLWKMSNCCTMRWGTALR